MDNFHEILSSFQKYVDSPEQFMQHQHDRAEIFRSMTKTLYDSTDQAINNEEIVHQALPKLIVKDFDDEQVWQQLELRNVPVTTYFNKSLKGLNLEDITLGTKTHGSQIEPDHLHTDAIDADSDELSDYAFDGTNSDSSEEPNSKNKKNKFDDAPIDSFEESIPKKDLASHNQKSFQDYRESVVDDKFFKLSQLEEFLRYEDLKEERPQDEASSDESDVDLFADIPSDNEEDSEEEFEQKEKNSKEIMFHDFFDPPQQPYSVESFAEPKFDDSDADDDDINLKQNLERKQKSVKFNQNIESYGKLQLLEDSKEDNASESNLKYEKSNSKTIFEQQQEKERRRMINLEESLLKEKPWQFTGEVSAGNRPQDSLIHQQTEFDSNLKPDFVSTDEMTERVENIIKMAITNKAWGDVEIKVKPVEENLAYKPKEPLDQSKSKQSLAELYEEEYVKKFEKETEKENPQHAEITQLMESTVNTLTALFSFMPRQPVPEIKIVNNMPSITVEEVAPVGVSDATLLAPEEIKAKSGVPIGKSERTETDKKRERRKKKKFQKIKELQNEERGRKKASISDKEARKFDKQQALKKLKQQKNVTVVNEKKIFKKKIKQ